MMTNCVIKGKNNVFEENDYKCLNAKGKANARIRQYIEDNAAGIIGYSDEEKNEYVFNIYRKYRSGKKLSAKEMNYLRLHDPETYMHAMRVKLKRNILEEKLKHCRTKRQAKQIYADAVVSINDKDPDKEVLIAAYKEAWKDFKKSSNYTSLQSDDKEEYTVRVKEDVYVNCAYTIDAEYAEVYSEYAIYDAEV